ncbi:hypothetical protein B4Q13_16015, partial [Lacticaseibacillus rhamnosus]
EELLRRSDLFVSVLTYREQRENDFTAADQTLRCSPYSLCEIRLAERADIPRLILFERGTGFKPPLRQRPWEVYVPFDRGARDQLPEHSQWTKVVEPKIDGASVSLIYLDGVLTTAVTRGVTVAVRSPTTTAPRPPGDFAAVLAADEPLLMVGGQAVADGEQGVVLRGHAVDLRGADDVDVTRAGQHL